MDDARRLALPDGVTLTYRLWRAPANPKRRTLVLLHGLASNRTRWNEFTEQTTLKRSWDILRPDLRGHGESFTRTPINLEIWCDDLARLLNAEGVQQAVLAGHSLGAQVALYFAARHPKRVAGLTLIDPVYRPALRGPLAWAGRLSSLLRIAAALLRLLNRLGLRRRQLPLRDLRALDEATRAALAQSGEQDDIVRRYTSPLADLKYFPTAHYFQELVEVTRSLPPPADIRVPVLVLLSKGVTFTDPEIMRAWIAQFPSAEIHAIDAWHWPLTERPIEVREAIEKFCDQRT